MASSGYTSAGLHACCVNIIFFGHFVAEVHLSMRSAIDAGFRKFQSGESMTRYLLVISLLVVPVSAQSTRQPTQKKDTSAPVRYINPPELAVNPRFTQLVEISGGRTILISGQVAYDKDGKVVGKGDIRAQSKQVFENLKAALDSVGATFNDVVKLNTFMV